MHAIYVVMIHLCDHQSRGPSPLRSSADVKPCLGWGGSGLWGGPLDAKCCDEDVHHDDDEDKGGRRVFQDVQLVVLAFIVQVPLHCSRKSERRK